MLFFSYCVIKKKEVIIKNIMEGSVFMKCNLACKVERKISAKNNNEYYVLTIEELGVETFLKPTEVKLFELLVNNGTIKIIEE